MTPVPDSELRRLTDKLLDEGGLSASEARTLAGIVRDPDALDWFLSMVQQEALLREIIPDYVTGLDDVTRPVRGARLRFIRIAAGFAAALAIVAIGVATMKYRKETDPGARVTALVGVRWSPVTTHPDLLAGGFAPGHLAMEAGLAEITYGNGVRVTIEGPCDYSISGADAGRLAFGKLVAHVPHGAEGFRVDYARGRVVDLGTEFAMDVSADGATEVGVFEGKIEVHHGDAKMMPLYADQAVQASVGDDTLQPVPLDRDKFIRQVPSRDFRWEVRGGKTLKFSADVSHLIWKAANYRLLFKAFSGALEAKVRDVRLLCDGRPVSADSHGVLIGTHRFVSPACIFRADVPESGFTSGKWTVEAEIETDPAADATGRLLGILQFEEGMVTHATEKDFLGTWTYAYSGHRYRRVIRPGGVVKLFRDDAPDSNGFKDGRWVVSDGILRIEAANIPAPELHVLRDKDTLVFANRPYENAKRADRPEKN